MNFTHLRHTHLNIIHHLAHPGGRAFLLAGGGKTSFADCAVGRECDGDCEPIHAKSQCWGRPAGSRGCCCGCRGCCSSDSPPHNCRRCCSSCRRGSRGWSRPIECHHTPSYKFLNFSLLNANVSACETNAVMDESRSCIHCSSWQFLTMARTRLK